MTTNGFRLITFGGLSFEASGGAPPLFAGQRKRLALLAFIAASNGNGTGRDKLLAMFWPESDADQARNALNQLLYAVRRELGTDAITGNSELALNPSMVWADVSAFRTAIANGRLTDAVALYRGPFLDSFFARGMPEFDRWVEEERGRLLAAYTRALESLATAASRSGQHVDAAGWWRQCASADPLSSRVAKAYAEALAASGDDAAARRHLTVHAALLRSELGTEPPAWVLTLEPRDPGFTADRAVHTVSPGTAHPPTFSAPVPRDEPELHAPAQKADGHESARAGDARTIARPTSAHTRSKRWGIALGLASMVSVAIAAAALVLRKPPAPEPASVAVIGFENDTGEPAFDKVARIITAHLNGSLTNTRLLTVYDYGLALGVERDSAGRVRPPLAIARDLNAGTLVTGILYKAGDTLRVGAKIIRVFNDETLAETEVVSVPASDTLGMLEPLRQRVLGALAALQDTRLNEWIRIPAAVPRLDAYRAYVEGRDGLVAQQPDSAWTKLMRAARLDPAFRGSAHLMLEIAELKPQRAGLVDSLIAAAESSRDSLTPFEQASLDAAIAYQRGDWAARLAATAKRVQIAPYLQDAHHAYAHALIANNYFDDAIRELHQLNVDRSWLGKLPMFWRFEMNAHHYAGDHEGALRELRRARERFPDDLAVCISMADQSAAMGRTDEVQRSVDACRSIAGKDFDPMNLAGQFAVEMRAHGHLAEARKLAAAALASRVQMDSTRPYPLLRAVLGEWSDAYRLFKVADTTNTVQRAQGGVLAGYAGDSATARATAGWLAEKAGIAKQPSDILLLEARVAAARGEKAAAVDFIRQAMKKGLAPAFQLHAAWELANLRGYKPYEELVKPRRLP